MTKEEKHQASSLFLREWRKTHGVTLESMARRLETTRTTVGRWEQGTVSLTVDQLVSYADALGLKPVDLFRSPSEPSGVEPVDQIPASPDLSAAYGERASQVQRELEEVKAERDRLAEKVAILSNTVAALGKVR